jgi:hypothetical protein
LTFTIVRLSVRGGAGPAFRYVTAVERRVFSMPVMSGYGPIVSSGLTTQAEPLTVTVVPPVDVVDEFVEDGEVGDEPPQAAATAATPADPRTSSALRLVNRAMAELLFRVC